MEKRGGRQGEGLAQGGFLVLLLQYGKMGKESLLTVLRNNNSSPSGRCESPRTTTSPPLLVSPPQPRVLPPSLHLSLLSTLSPSRPPSSPSSPAKALALPADLSLEASLLGVKVQTLLAPILSPKRLLLESTGPRYMPLSVLSVTPRRELHPLPACKRL